MVTRQTLEAQSQSPPPAPDRVNTGHIFVNSSRMETWQIAAALRALLLPSPSPGFKLELEISMSLLVSHLD